jgi:hypothetical protein
VETQGSWKQHVITAFPLVVAVGITALTPLATAAASPDAVTASILASLGTSLAASGLAALCKPRRFLAGHEYKDQLANHDIRRLIRNAWGEAAAATVKGYAESEAKRAATLVTLLNPRPSPRFLRLVEKMKPQDFAPEQSQINLITIRSAIDASRRSLVPEADNGPKEQDLREHVETLKSALIDAVIDAIGKYGEKQKVSPEEVPLPPDFTSFLAGPEGIFAQLCAYVAYHLKVDPHAQIAVLHFSLQGISDRQAEFQSRLDRLCEEIYNRQDEANQKLLHDFEARIAEQTRAIQAQIDLAFNKFVKPRLDLPFALDTRDSRLPPFAEFTYRARRTPLIGRESALDTLVRFLADPRPGLWTIVSGPAGTGKSRLAAELIAMVRESAPGLAAGSTSQEPIGQWRAGFLQREWLKNDALKWSPDADTLMVIDRAGETDIEDLSNFLRALSRPRESDELSDCAIRVLLIDRLPPHSEFGLAKRLTRGNDYQNDILGAYFGPSKPESEDPLALKKLADVDALRIAEDWAGSKWTSDALERLSEAMKRDGELARPLFAALLGHAILTDGLRPGELNPVTVAETALLHQFRPSGQSNSWLEPAKDLLAAVTAGRGMSEEDLFAERETVCSLTGELALSDTAETQIKFALRALVGTRPDGTIPHLEPDFLGGIFVLQRLLHLSDRRCFEKAGSLMSVA